MREREVKPTTTTTKNKFLVAYATFTLVVLNVTARLTFEINP
jgi:hypothetical protein